AGEADRRGAEVRDLEPVGSERAVAARPGCRLRDRQVDGPAAARGGDRQRVRGAGVGRGTDRRVVYIDGDVVGRVVRRVQRGPRFEEERGTGDLERGGIRTGDGQRVVTEAVVADEDVRELDRGARVRVFGQRGRGTHQGNGRGREVLRRGRGVHPELRVGRVTTARLVDDVELAVAVHRDAFHRHVRHRDLVARVGDDRQGVLDAARAVDLHDLARFLADDEELLEGGIPRQRRQVRQGEHVGEVER